MLSPKPLDEIQPNLMCEFNMNGVCNSNFFGGHAPGGTGKGSKGQISFNFKYKVNFNDFYTKLCVCSYLTNERYKTYQTGFSFCCLGHDPGVGIWGAGGVGRCPGGSKIIFFKHGHVAYEVNRDEKQKRVEVKFSSYGQTGDLGVRSKVKYQ